MTLCNNSGGYYDIFPINNDFLLRIFYIHVTNIHTYAYACMRDMERRW